MRKYGLLLAVIAVMLGGLVVPNQTGALTLDPNPCVGLASDSNGFGQVTFQLPPDGDVGIIFVRPLWMVLQDQLNASGLTNLKVIDRSLSAGGLTSSERTNYLKSIPYGNLINDRCRFVVAGPFIPDVAAAKATPKQYSVEMVRLINGLIDKNPRGTIFILKHYQTQRAEFTASNNGFGMTRERIDAFNEQLTEYCRPDGLIGRNPQVICVDTQSFFEDMDTAYVLTGATRAEYDALVYRPTGFQKQVEAFFQENPDARLIGDGIHLSLAGRIRLSQRMAQMIARLSDF